jgi:polygalacturonase
MDDPRSGLPEGRTTRRRFLGYLCVGAGASLLPTGLFGCASSQAGRTAYRGEGWEMVPDILSRIRAPRFPDRTFLLTDYGAAEDAETDASQAFSDAIAACNAAGGGRVVVPEGTFLTGPIYLRSNVELHVAEGARILFTRDTTRYPLVMTRWEGVELMNYSPFIYAYGEENIAITGLGTIDGNADCEHWWPWKGRTRCGWSEGDPREHPERDRLFRLGEEGAPIEDRVFGEGSYLRPNLIQTYRCNNVLLEDFTINNSPMWCMNPVLSNNVTIRGVQVISHGPNSDGCNPESCRDVLIENCYFDTGDDCIAIKSGRNAEGRRIAVPSENIVIRNCHMKDGHGGVVAGSEMSGGVRNVFAEDCTMDSPRLQRALRIKTNSVRGGFVENVYMRNCQIGEVADAVFRVNYFYEEGDTGDYNPLVRNVEMRDVTVRKTRYPLFIRGYEYEHVKDVRLVDVRIEQAEEESVIENVTGLRLENVYINGQRFEA